jgi:RND family efflux transporter MFP subunit
MKKFPFTIHPYLMKTNIYLLFCIPAALLLSCGEKQANDKKAELDKLKKQQAEITAKIKTLESEIGESTTGAAHVKVVTADEVVSGVFENELIVQGHIEAPENVVANTKSPAPATVTRILVKEGALVKSGQLLAETDVSAMVSGMEAAKVQLATASVLYEKYKKLWEQKIGTEVQYINVKSQKEAAEKQVNALSEQINMSRIYAPIDGVVDEVMLKVGQPASSAIPGNGIRIVNMSKLKARADIAETYARSVRAGNNVTVEFPDGGDMCKSTLSYVGKSINNLTRTFHVEVALPEKGTFQANALAVLRIIDYRNEKALTVPVNCVQNSDEGHYVMLMINKGKGVLAEKRMVSIGKNNGRRVEILSGLTAGERVITFGFQDLNSGDPVALK